MSILTLRAWYRVGPFNLEIYALLFEIFLYYFKKLFLFNFRCSHFYFLALEPPGVILSCFTIFVLCSNFWEFPTTFIFAAFSSMIMFLLYKDLFCFSECPIFSFNNILLFHGFRILFFWREFVCELAFSLSLFSSIFFLHPSPFVFKADLSCLFWPLSY